MIKIFIIADDITGALDTGVKFSAVGMPTRVILNVHADFENEQATEVLVVCAPTRHLPANEAYEMICDITRRAVRAGVQCIIKKTDSALRGNVGAELCAVLDGSGSNEIFFVPALPEMQRITRGGIHYIDGLPVHESVFGHDPFEPVRESYVPALLKKQCTPGTQVVSCSCPPERESFENTIYVFDCDSAESMNRILSGLHRKNKPLLLAGCAGLAASLTSGKPVMSPPPRREPRTTVLCGSINPISLQQLDYAEAEGFSSIHVPAELLLTEAGPDSEQGRLFQKELWTLHRSSSALLIDSRSLPDNMVEQFIGQLGPEGLRRRISDRLGYILRDFLDCGAETTLMIIGGDTLLSFLQAIRHQELCPVCELQPGVVLSTVNYRSKSYDVISKSGGFGERNLLPTLVAI